VASEVPESSHAPLLAFVTAPDLVGVTPCAPAADEQKVRDRSDDEAGHGEQASDVDRLHASP
jgi:hypothetical protein